MAKLNPYQKFMTQNVQTMTKPQMLVALYDKAIVELNKGILYIEDKNIPQAHNSIMKVSNIVDEFDSCLKVKYEITDTLATMYGYFRDQLIQANVKKDAQILKNLLPYFTDLRNSFAEADKAT